MLVFISDLHLADGTAGRHNIPPQAFEYFFDDLIAITKKESNRIEEVKIVLLGDTFDFLRTTYWLDFPEAHMPWGDNEAAVETHALTLFDAIVAQSENRLSIQKILEGLERLQSEAHLRAPVELVFFTGNHERLVDKYPSLRQKITDLLGPHLEPGPQFHHSRTFAEYRVFARHGHEFDQLNWEGGSSHTPDDYKKASIGDPITTELLVRLSYELTSRIDPLTWLTPKEKETLRRNFQGLDNIRPISAVVEWLIFQVRRLPLLKRLIQDTVADVVEHFESLNFVQDWYRRHDRWQEWHDEADQIQAVLFLLRNFKIYSTEQLWRRALQAGSYFYQDYLREAAQAEYVHLDSAIRYVTYGHTHEPQVTALLTAPGPEPLERIYLNTGTWRTVYHRGVFDRSFIAWKNMTYAIFYRDGERPERKADFETWTGNLKAV